MCPPWKQPCIKGSGIYFLRGNSINSPNQLFSAKEAIFIFCQNPCANQCGVNANCNPRRHIAVCTCPAGYNGDALIQCYPERSSEVAGYRVSGCSTC
ncbi:hypothetical protein NQ318_011231 [Aromia moschata]|uniref:EGF-like domain-containing protein n=1 Tax=Aromia moschata TaxID=1265417 RepID=A0AAV8YH06_9CUCU|nr:hypothetical protein NQ318_011231 [Aromia moschata]